MAHLSSFMGALRPSPGFPVFTIVVGGGSIRDGGSSSAFPVSAKEGLRGKTMFGSLKRVLTNHRLRLISKVAFKQSSEGGGGGNWSKPPFHHPHSSTDDIHDLEGQLDEFFVQVKTLFDSGNEDGAIRLLEANYERVKEDMELGVRGIEQAAILDVLALGYMGVGRFNTSKYILGQLREIVDTLGNETPLLDSILIHMGGMYTSSGMAEESLPLYERAFKIEGNMLGGQSLFLVTPLLGMAKAFASIGRSEKAVQTYHQVIDLYERNGGVDNEDLVIPLSSLGNLLINEGKTEVAKNSFNRIIGIYSKLYGERDGRVGMALCSLAHAFCGQGDINEAINLYKKGLRIVMDSEYLSLDDSVLQKIKTELAELLHVAGSEQEGRAVLEESLLTIERIRGPGHPDSVTHLQNLAASYSRSKNFVEAERLLRRSVQILQDAVGVDHSSISDPMLDLSVVLYHLHKNEEAETLALQALQIREDAYGHQSSLVGEALDCLVSIQSRLGKDDEVLPLLWRVLAIQEKEFGYESKEVLNTLMKLIFYLRKARNDDKRLPLQQRLMKLRLKYKDLITPT